MVRKGLALYLSLCTLLLGALMPLQGFAMLVPSDTVTLQGSISDTQARLETKLVAQRLSDLGFTEEEIQARTGGLTNEQLHQFAQSLDGLQTGGDALIILAIVAAVIVVLALITGFTHGIGDTGHHAAHDTGHTVAHDVY
jgi:hypothetical protein